MAFLVGLIIAGEFTPSTIVAVAPPSAARGGESVRPAAVPALPSVVNFADVAERINAAVVNIDSTSKASDAREPQRYFRRGDGPIEGPSRAISTSRGRVRAAASSSIATGSSSRTITSSTRRSGSP